LPPRPLDSPEINERSPGRKGRIGGLGPDWFGLPIFTEISVPALSGGNTWSASRTSGTSLRPVRAANSARGSQEFVDVPIQ
jgi:hypothetical protein